MEFNLMRLNKTKVFLVTDNSTYNFLINEANTLYVEYLKSLLMFNRDLQDDLVHGKLTLRTVAKEEINSAINEPYNELFLFVNDSNDIKEDSFLGFAIVGVNPNSYGASDIYIQEFFVAPEYRGQGIGREAVYKIIDCYKKDRLYNVSLCILENNYPAKSFWDNVFPKNKWDDLIKTKELLPPENLNETDGRKHKSKVEFHYYSRKKGFLKGLFK